MPQTAGMLPWRAILSILLTTSSADVAIAQGSAQEPSGATSPQLSGISPDEADQLVARLQDRQRRLQAGEDVFFELLSGAPASYPMTTVSPRDAFLQMRFDEAFIIARMRTYDGIGQAYRLTFMPNGPGQLVWDVEVVLGFYGDVERVTMLYRPPHPF